MKTGQMWGARPAGDGSWTVALWAPSAQAVAVVLEGRTVPLAPGPDGCHRGRIVAAEGAPYALRVDGRTIADPASRWQDGMVPQSRLLDPGRLRRAAFQAGPADAAVICEMHIGSFTPEGTFAAAARSDDLRRLADLGFTAVEIMPVGQFPGRSGWGYDSVLPHAPFAPYGPPDDLCALVDAIHALGMAAYLDVVFNHFGPEGCDLVAICPEFFEQGSTEWGRAIDFRRRAVREYFITCALGWVVDYGFDGLRFDAVERLVDDGDPPFLEEMALRLRDCGRVVHLFSEDSRNITALVDPQRGLYDGEWNDDYHHALHVLLTGETQNYYRPFAPMPLDDLCLSLRDGYVMQGQARPDGTAPKGEPSAALPWPAFVNFNLNHDQAGNRARGERLVTLVGDEVALVAHALLLCAPFTPLLFMGEEVGSRAPFPFFADYTGPLADAMRQGRVDHLGEEPGFAARMIDPMVKGVLATCYPYRDPAPARDRWLAVTRELLALRRDRLLPIYRSGRAAPAEAAATGPQALMARWACNGGTVTVAACFGGPQDMGTGDPAVFDLGVSLAGSPFFRLWID